MRKNFLLSFFLSSLFSSLYGQKLREDAKLDSYLETSLIQQIGSENRIFFRNSDAMPNFVLSENTSIRQIGNSNVLMISDLKKDGHLEIDQQGFNNSLLIRDLGVPLRIQQFGGMELSIRGSNMDFLRQ